MLTDLMMPFMDGSSLIWALQRLDPAVKSIAASGLGSESDLDEVRQLGVRAYLHKPFATPPLLQNLRAVLEGAEVEF